jgi:predicted nucleic acid-binding protein
VTTKCVWSQSASPGCRNCAGSVVLEAMAAPRADAELWIDRIERGLVRMSTVTRLEIGYSTRTAAQARLEVASPPLSLMSVAQAASCRAPRIP